MQLEQAVGYAPRQQTFSNLMYGLEREVSVFYTGEPCGRMVRGVSRGGGSFSDLKTPSIDIVALKERARLAGNIEVKYSGKNTLIFNENLGHGAVNTYHFHDTDRQTPKIETNIPGFKPIVQQKHGFEDGTPDFVRRLLKRLDIDP